MSPKIWTIGHSTRRVEDLIGMLTAAGVSLLVDVRAFPRSRRYPQFNREALASSLEACGIAYRWEGQALGGFRKPRAQSPNAGLRNPSFRGYADYMESADFSAAAGKLIEWAGDGRLALMCAEQHPSRCHRRLISDWLMARGLEIEHLLEAGRVERHELSEGAVIASGAVAYPGRKSQLELALGPSRAVRKRRIGAARPARISRSGSRGSR